MKHPPTPSSSDLPGVGRPPAGWDGADYVSWAGFGPMNGRLSIAIERAPDAVTRSCEMVFLRAANVFNRVQPGGRSRFLSLRWLSWGLERIIESAPELPSGSLCAKDRKSAASEALGKLREYETIVVPPDVGGMM